MPTLPMGWISKRLVLFKNARDKPGFILSPSASDAVGSPPTKKQG